MRRCRRVISRWPLASWLILAALSGLFLTGCVDNVSFTERLDELQPADGVKASEQLRLFVQEAVCSPDCAAQTLTRAHVADVLARLEANVDVPDSRKSEIDALTTTICSGACSDGPMHQQEIKLILWHWLGRPGWPLFEAGLASEPLVVAAAFFAKLSEPAEVPCPDRCEATSQYMADLIDGLRSNGLLDGLAESAPIPADLVGVGPFWTSTPWRPADQLCLDDTERPRYGMYTGTSVCVSPELEASLRADVALHELGHVWQHWSGSETEDAEADADCWADLHGAAWMNYLADGCDQTSQMRLLERYARSLSLTSD